MMNLMSSIIMKFIKSDLETDVRKLDLYLGLASRILKTDLKNKHLNGSEFRLQEISPMFYKLFVHLFQIFN